MVLGPLGAAKPLPLGQGACRPSQVNMSLREFATCFLQLTNKLRSIDIFRRDIVAQDWEYWGGSGLDIFDQLPARAPRKVQPHKRSPKLRDPPHL